MAKTNRRSGRYQSKRRHVRSKRYSKRRRGGALDFNKKSCAKTFEAKNQGADYSKPRYSACKYRYPGLYREQLDPYTADQKKTHTKWLSRRWKGTKKMTKDELKNWAKGRYPVKVDDERVSEQNETPRNSLPGALPNVVPQVPDDLLVSNTLPSDLPMGTGFDTPIVQWTPPGSGSSTPRGTTSNTDLNEVARKLQVVEPRSGGSRSKRRPGLRSSRKKTRKFSGKQRYR